MNAIGWMFPINKEKNASGATSVGMTLLNFDTRFLTFFSNQFVEY